MKDLSSMLKQAQEMQKRMAEMQAALEDAEVEGSAGGGLVRVVLNGKGAMKAVHIDPSLAGPDDVEVLEDLILAAHADARTRVDQHAAEEMKKVTGGIALPPGLDLGAG